MTTKMVLSELASRLRLSRRFGGSDRWRGDCPACGYKNALTLSVKHGHAVWWCASCGSNDALTAAVRNIAGTETPIPALGQTARALALFEAALPIEGSPVATYLGTRALAGYSSRALRFLGQCPHPTGGRFPAMLAAVSDPVTNTLCAVHRTFLAPGGHGKAALDPVRASLGPVSRGVVLLRSAVPGRSLVIGEGIETSASAGLLLDAPAWAAASAGNLAALVLPDGVRDIIVAADADEPGQRAAWTAARRWRAEGRAVRVATPDITGTDFNDLACGVAAKGAAHAG